MFLFITYSLQMSRVEEGREFCSGREMEYISPKMGWGEGERISSDGRGSVEIVMGFPKCLGVGRSRRVAQNELQDRGRKVSNV